MLTQPDSSLIQSGGYSPPERQEKLRCNVLLTTVVACLGPLSFGFVLGYASPVKTQLQHEFPNLNEENLSWFNVSRTVLFLFLRKSVRVNRCITDVFSAPRK